VSLTAWRIVETKHKGKAFTGDGARLYGGRWNSKGVAMVYTAGSLALASIEIVVNLPSPKLLEAFIRIPVRFASDLVEQLPDSGLPRDWQSRPISPTTRAIGDKWVEQQRSAVLKVPSVVVPEEFNYLINPAHPDFHKIDIGQPVVYHFDPRLAKARPAAQ
jgi:RES domain-containing protein